MTAQETLFPKPASTPVYIVYNIPVFRNLKLKWKDSLELQIEKVINEDTDKIYIFRMNKEQLNECTMMGQAFDEKLVTDEVKALFFWCKVSILHK